MDSVIYRNNSNYTTQSMQPPKSPTDLKATGRKQAVTLTWSDPDDLLLSDGRTIVWKYTRIVKKASGYPENENDGIIVVESSIRNQYIVNGYDDSGLGYSETWYYAAFTCSEDGVFSKEICQATATTKPAYRLMTVIINENESDPTKMCSYADDAVGAPSGYNDEATAFWKEFFGYRPCLFRDGNVQAYLDPNDFSKDENGNDMYEGGTIYSDLYADVMIEYPKRGVKMSRSDNVVTISVTDNPDASGFTYYAHMRSTGVQDNFYLGTYISAIQTPTQTAQSRPGLIQVHSDTYANIKSTVSDKGDYYNIMSFYQHTYIQIMYCFQFANNLNSQEVLGYGTNDGISSSTPTGSTSTRGMVYGTPGTTGDLKLFGLEWLWGSYHTLVGGVRVKLTNFSQGTIGICTAKDGHDVAIGSGDDYIDTNIKYNTSRYIRYTSGNLILGFVPRSVSTSLPGSSTTYYCDALDIPSISINSYSVGLCGGTSNSSKFGIFHMSFDQYNPSKQYIWRLMYC